MIDSNQSDSAQSHSPDGLIQKLKDDPAPSQVGALLEQYRNYLKLLAETHLNQRVRKRVDGSDIVQETFLEAHQAFHQFQGTSEGELIGWLRKILIHNVLDQAKHQGAKRRDIKRELSLEATLERSSVILGGALFAATTSPSFQTRRREQSVLIADAIAKLPDEQRAVIISRQIHHKKFSDIAIELDKTSGAVRMIWLRALEQLRRIMRNEDQEP